MIGIVSDVTRHVMNVLHSFVSFELLVQPEFCVISINAIGLISGVFRI